MKNLALYLLTFMVFALMLTACEKTAISPESLSFKNTKWGMTKAEIEKALNLQESDLLKVEIPYGENESDNYLVDNYLYDGYNCKLTLVFSINDSPTKKARGLAGVELLFTETAPVLTAYDEYLKELGTPQFSNDNDITCHFIWESTKSVLDYFDGNEQAIDQFLDEYYTWAAEGSFDENGVSPLGRPKKDDIDKLSLGRVEMAYNKEANTDGTIAVLRFSGLCLS